MWIKSISCDTFRNLSNSTVELINETCLNYNYNDISEDFDHNNVDNQTNFNTENNSNYQINFRDISETTND